MLNWNFDFSVSAMLFITDKEKFAVPGPTMLPTPAVPKYPRLFSGMEKAEGGSEGDCGGGTSHSLVVRLAG